MRGRRALDDRGLGRVLLRLIAATDAAGGVSFGLAFAAGLLSFLSPCVLPLIPSYVGFLTGLSLEELQASEEADVARRSEEHTSELQSQSNLVCRLLLEKKKKSSTRPNPHRAT